MTMTTTNIKISASNFREPLLQILGSLTEYKANRPIAFKETYDPVCLLLDITADQYGKQTGSNCNWVEKWIQWAFRALRKEGLGVSAGRGQWALTTQGVLMAQAAQNLTATTMDPTPAKIAAPVTIPVMGVSVAVGPGEPDKGSYHPDPYIRALAVQNTKCFGHYTPKGGALCEHCPLQGPCKNAMAALFSMMAGELAVGDQEAEREASRVKAQVQTPTPDPAPAPAPSRPGSPHQGQGGGEAKWGKGQKIEIQQQCLCKACGQEIQQGGEAVWVRSSSGNDKAGVFHPECYGA